MSVSAFTLRLITHALAELAERIEKMPDATFLSEHQAVHDEVRTPAIDMVAAVLEREWWRRFPEGSVE
jgi:hypothetical protein